jgi:hypothetical protein
VYQLEDRYLPCSGGTSTSHGHGSENFTLLLPLRMTWIFIVCSLKWIRVQTGRYFLFVSGGTSTSQGHGSENFTLLLPFFTTWIFMISSPLDVNDTQKRGLLLGRLGRHFDQPGAGLGELHFVAAFFHYLNLHQRTPDRFDLFAVGKPWRAFLSLVVDDDVDEPWTKRAAVLVVFLLVVLHFRLSLLLKTMGG